MAGNVETDLNWGRLSFEAAMAAGSGVGGLVVGAWRWGRHTAKHEQKVKDDYETKIAELRDELMLHVQQIEKAASDRNETFADQFKESFEGLRRQMDDSKLA